MTVTGMRLKQQIGQARMSMRLGSQRRILRERRDEAMKIIVTFGPVIGAAIMAVYVFVLRIYVSAKELLFCAA